MQITELTSYLNKDVELSTYSVLKTGRKEIQIQATGLKLENNKAVIIFEPVPVPKVTKPVKKGSVK